MNLTTISATQHESIHTQKATALDQLVIMRYAEGGKPLFCIHPSGGDIGVYRKFAARTSPELSVFGIQSRLQCGATSEHSSLGRMAFAYADLINEHQPVGEIRLLGFSLGGFLASLIASELQQFGRTVSFLGLIDSNPNWTVASNASRQELCLRLTQVFTKFQSIGVMQQKPLETVERDVAVLVDSCMSDPPVSSAEAMAITTALGYVPSRKRDSELIMKFTDTFLTHCRLLKDFEPPEINCPLHLWWPSDAAHESKSGSEMWAQRAHSTVSESIIEGSHYSIMRGASVRALSAEVEAAIAQCDEVNA